MHASAHHRPRVPVEEFSRTGRDSRRDHQRHVLAHAFSAHGSPCRVGRRPRTRSRRGAGAAWRAARLPRRRHDLVHSELSGFVPVPRCFRRPNRATLAPVPVGRGRYDRCFRSRAGLQKAIWTGPRGRRASEQRNPITWRVSYDLPRLLGLSDSALLQLRLMIASIFGTSGWSHHARVNGAPWNDSCRDPVPFS